ncbi:Calcineurin-like phosphoesterase domain-containing protein [Entamoeba marina]
MQKELTLCIISDTHCHHKHVTITPCDILICCGDFAHGGNQESVESFSKWLEATPSKQRILVTGNHEQKYSANYPSNSTWITDHCNNVTLLKDDKVTIEGITFYGCFYNVTTYGGSNSDILNKKLSNVDVLITHQPPYDILDFAKNSHRGSSVISDALLSSSIKAHFFGHAHSSYGAVQSKNILYVNAALTNDKARKIVNQPVMITYKSECFTVTNIKTNVIES